MSDKKKKIEKYIEAEKIGKAEQKKDTTNLNGKDAVVKIQIESDSIEQDADASDVTPQPEPGESEKKAKKSVDSAQMDFETAKQEAKENYDRYLRVYADFENYKKRSAREMEEFRKFANESLLKEMLNVVDNLERAIDSSNTKSENNASIVEGIQMTLKEILSIFEKFQVTPIDSPGKPFDPRYHQAFQQEESDEYPENTVIRELQKGYLLHDRLLRPAMVMVSKKKKAPGAGDEN